MAIVWQGIFNTSEPENSSGPHFSPYAKEIFENGYEETNYSTQYELVGGADADLFESYSHGWRMKAEYLENYLGYEQSNKVFELTFRATHAWFDLSINDYVYTEGVQTYSVSITDISARAPEMYGGAVIYETAVNGDAVRSQIAATDWGFYDSLLGDGTGGVTVTLSNDAGGRFYLEEVDGLYTLRVANASLLNYDPAHDLFDIAIDVSDGTTTQTGHYQVRVGNAAPSTPFDANGAAGGLVAEHAAAGTSVGVTVHADDPKGGVVTYGFDNYNSSYISAFAINATTGVITVKDSAALNFEGIANGIAALKVIASDAHGGTSAMTVSVTVTDKNDAPVVHGLTAFTIDENDGRYVGMLNASDEDLLPQPDILSYSLSGTDAALFTVDSEGNINFKASPNFEAPADKNLDNVYAFNFIASDGATSTSQAITVTVENVDEAPVFTSVPITIHVNEYTPTSTIIHKFTAVDPDGTHVTYTTGSLDAFLAFDIDSSGNLRFNYSPDFDNPFDFNRDNTYLVEIKASAGNHQVSQAITVIVDDINAPPVIQNYGSAASALRLIDENWIYAVDFFSAYDPDGGEVTWSISGTDAAKFTIDASGILRLKTPADFENPTDANKDNVYNVTVKASDGFGSDSIAMSVEIEDIAEVVTKITSNGGSETATINATENVRAVTTVSASGNGTRTYSLVNGLDSADFTINSATGALTFAQTPNFEAPADADKNNSYSVVVRATDGKTTDQQTLIVKVGNVNEAPVINSNGGGSTATIAAAENNKTVTTVQAADPEKTALTYSLSGTDKGDFIINSKTGALSFAATPDFEKPADSNKDNSYSVTVIASDGVHTDSQALTVKVGNVNEAPVITSNGGAATASLSIAENKQSVATFVATDAEAGKLTWSLSGTDKGDFVINSKTGALSFAVAPDFEKPADSNKDNSYSVRVIASDGMHTDSQALTVKVGNVNERPVITSAASLSIAENKQSITTFVAADAEAGKLTWSLSGTDKGDFVINSKTGALSFAAAPDFEKPTDSNKDNSYSVTVIASDGVHTDSQALTVKVSDVAGKIVTGTNLPNTLNGTVEADYISGLDGNDVIKAGAGTDLIEGGKGADDLYGGAADKSADLFIFDKSDSGKSATTWDQVFNFERGLDKIAFSKIDADGAKGIQDLRFVTTFTKATGAAADGQFRVIDDGANVKVLVDVDGDLATDMVIQVMSVDTLTFSDFLL